jgi:hypothetical protein
VDEAGDRFPKRVPHDTDYFSSLCVGDQRHGAAINEHVADLVGNEPEIDRYRDRSHPVDGKQDRYHLDGVPHEHHHAVAFSDSGIRQDTGQTVYQVIEFGVGARVRFGSEGHVIASDVPMAAYPTRPAGLSS